MMMLPFKDVQEQTRTYFFGDDKVFIMPGVTKVATLGSTHILETADGRKYIVNSNWLAIQIDAKEWSF